MTVTWEIVNLYEVRTALVKARVYARLAAHEDTRLAIQAAIDRIEADIKAVEAEPEP